MVTYCAAKVTDTHDNTYNIKAIWVLFGPQGSSAAKFGRDKDRCSEMEDVAIQGGHERW